MSTVKLPFYGLRAEVVNGSINVSERTIDVCFGTDTPILRRGWDGPYYEQLSFNPSHVRMERISGGSAPVLDNHQSWGSVATTQMGVVVRAWIEGNKGYAKLRFSKKEAAEVIWKDIEDGIVRNVSVGYKIYTVEHTEKIDGPDLYRAIDWEPAEISVTQVPADYFTGIRSRDEAPCHNANIIKLNHLQMRNGNQNPAGENDDVETRGANNPTPNPPPTPPIPVETRSEGDIAEQIRAAIAADRVRSSTIVDLVQRAQIPNGDVYALELIRGEMTMDAARAAILDRWNTDVVPLARAANPQITLVGEDVVDKRRSAMSAALMHRAGSLIGELPQDAREYRSLSLIRMASMALEQAGVNTRHMGDIEIARLALNGRSGGGMLSTSDFPIMLGNTVNTVLRSYYEMAPRTFTPFCRRSTAKDFREKHVAQLSQLMKGLKEVGEGGEYKRDSFAEAKESFRVRKYGEIVPITWEVIINDDLGFVSRIPQAMAYQAANLQNEIVWGILTSNPTMGDNVALFHTSTHKNLAGSGAAISNTSLSVARAAMRNQKDLNARNFVRVAPEYLLVGPDKETEAEQVINGIIVPTADSAVNVFKNKLKIIVEPLLTGNQWYLSASPNLIDTIEYSFLEGEGDVFTETRQGFEIDGMEVKIRMVFGAKAIDWRGLYKNPGA